MTNVARLTVTLRVSVDGGAGEGEHNPLHGRARSLGLTDTPLHGMGQARRCAIEADVFLGSLGTHFLNVRQIFPVAVAMCRIPTER